MVGSRQTEHKLQEESIEEDNMVKSRYSNTLVQRRTNKEDTRAISLKDLIRRCQGLAEG